MTDNLVPAVTGNGPKSGANAAFIAALGSCADELLAVVHAAYRVHDYVDSPKPDAQLQFEEAMFDLGGARQALDARLAAVLPGGEP